MPQPWKRNVATEHLRQLARDHDLRITWARDWMNSEASSCCVAIPRPWNARLYLVALHEFGHVLDPLARRLDRDVRPTVIDRDYMACEGAATGWAIAHVHDDLVAALPDNAVDYLGYGFRTHANGLARKRRDALVR